MRYSFLVEFRLVCDSVLSKQMNFDAVDSGIHAWAKRTRMFLYTEYMEFEVRSFQWVGASGRA